MRNPFLQWYETQPLTVTQASLARDLGASRTWVTGLMSPVPPAMPSLRLAMAIERRTGGVVRVQDIAVYIESATA